jgi:DNA-binding MarR family transcriptional regulator
MYNFEIPARQLEMYGHRLERTAKMMKLYFSRALASDHNIDITVDQYVVLNLLVKKGELNPQEIAIASYKDAPTITRILEILADKNYIIKSVDIEDKRRYNISISESGVDIVNKIEPIVQSFRQKCYDDISEQKLYYFSECLDTIFNNLTNNN